MLRIVLGYKSGDRRTDPEVIFIGHDADDAQRALDEAPDYPLITRGEFTLERRAKRSRQSIPSSPSPAPAPPSGGAGSDNEPPEVDLTAEVEEKAAEEKAKTDAHGDKPRPKNRS
jgi:hypothetical protein